jgi:hypothetical protein
MGRSALVEVAAVRRYLVVANQTLGGPELIDAVCERLSAGPCEFHVVVPATPVAGVIETYGPLGVGLPLLPPPDEESLTVARERLEAELARLRAAGAHADGEVGDPDPVRAIRTALAGRGCDEILLSTLPPGISRWLHWDLPSRVRRAVPQPVTHVCAKESR